MVYAGDFVIAGFPSGRLVALNAANGAVRWDVAVSEPRGATEVERLADVVGAPLVIGNEVCAASYQGRVGCFDATSGSLRWSSEISARSGPTADERRVYVVDAKSNVVAFNRAAGSSAWRQEKLMHRDLSAPLALRRAIVAGDFAGCRALSVSRGRCVHRTRSVGGRNRRHASASRRRCSRPGSRRAR